MAARAGFGRRVYRFLRRPLPAVLLLAFVGVWMFAGTNGLDNAYTHPVFLAAIAWLVLSTAVCAWERTGRALRVWRTRGTLTPSQLDRLRGAEPITLPLAQETDPAAALERAAAALRQLGLRVRSGPKLIEASSGAWALFASAVFHWALVALMLVIPLGQLTRSEGLMGVVGGSTRIDEAASYGALERGPLHRRMSGLTIGVEPDMELSFVEDGIDRGAAPTVTVAAADGTLLARQRVYPNHPLRQGPLTIHMSDFGVGVAYSLEDSSGAGITGQITIDFADEARTRVAPGLAVYENPDGSTFATVTVEALRSETGGPEDRRVALTVERPGAPTVEATAGQGELVDIGDGLILALENVDYYARLTVVDDRSVPLLYAFFLLAIASVSVSVLVPHRVAHVLLDNAGPLPVLRLSTRHSRGSPEFATSVRSALTAEENE